MKIIFLLAGALALSACDNVDYIASNGSKPVPAPTGAVATAGNVVLSGERAFALAELAYTTTADALVIPVEAGAFTSAQLEQIRKLNTKARALLVLGKQTADVAEKARLASQLFDVRDAINLIKGDR